MLDGSIICLIQFTSVAGRGIKIWIVNVQNADGMECEDFKLGRSSIGTVKILDITPNTGHFQ